MRTMVGVVAVLGLAAAACERDRADRSTPAPAGVPEPGAGAAAPLAPTEVEPRPVMAAEITITTRSPDARALFEQARALFDKLRFPEGRALLEQAILADPELALAHAMLGATEPGPAGDARLARAARLAVTLPEPERLLIERMIAVRDGRGDVVRATLDRLAEVAPGDWRVRVLVGKLALQELRNDDAIASFQQALALAPQHPEIYNYLAYTYALERRWDEAVAAARTQTELEPWEPNPQDTLGEIALWAGRFDDAEAAFTRAAGISPSFAHGWQGVGLARAYRGEYDRARAALAAGRTAATQPHVRLAFDVDAAWIALTAGRPADAARTLAAVEREARQLALPHHAAVPLVRGQMALVQGKLADARTLAQQAIDRAAAGTNARAERDAIRRDALMLRLTAEARLGRAAEAVATLSTLEADLRDLPDRDGVARRLAHGHGLVAWVEAGAAAAAPRLAGCDRDDLWCQRDLILALDAAGDGDGAAAARRALRARYHRDAAAVYLVQALAP